MPDETASGAAPESSTAAKHEPQTVIQLARWRAGDEQAFDEIHQRSLPWLRVRIRHHATWPALSRSMQLEDLLQEVWSRAFEPVRERFRHVGDGSLFAYLGCIADRVLVDLLRTNGARKRGPKDGNCTLQTDVDDRVRLRPGQSATETPTSAARENELRQLARTVLDESHYDVWELVEANGMSAEEVGDAIGRSGSAVRGMLFRARAKLSSRLGDGERPGSPRP